MGEAGGRPSVEEALEIATGACETLWGTTLSADLADEYRTAAAVLEELRELCDRVERERAALLTDPLAIAEGAWHQAAESWGSALASLLAGQKEGE